MATLSAEPIGCGALKVHGSEPAGIKRMWVSPDARPHHWFEKSLTA